MKQRYVIPMVLLAVMVLFGCGGDYNGPKLGSSTVLDITPPFIIATNPILGASNVATTAIISATFSEPVNPLLINTGTFTLTGGGAPVAGTVSLVGTTATFAPSAALTPGTLFTATLSGVITDLAGNAMGANFSWNFTTAATLDTTPPTVASVTPLNLATNVSINTNVSAVFSEALNAGSISPLTFLLSTGGSPVAGVASYAAGIATFNPTPTLSSNTTYSATLTTGVLDLAGNAMAAPFTWSFTTAPTPSITTTSPLPDAAENAFYSTALTSSGGFGTLTWSTSSTLPNTLSLSPGGVLSGTPQTGTAGPYTINVTLTDADGLIATKSLSLTVFAIPVISTTSLPPATVTATYNQALSAGGGSGSYVSWTATGLPPGLTFNTLTGAIGAAPTSAGTYTVNFTVTDSNAKTSPLKTLPLIVNAVPAVTTSQAVLDTAPAIVGSLYTFAMASSGGTGPLSWNAIGLPGSLSISATTGVISGTPASGDEAASPYPVGFTVTDANFVTSPTTTLNLTVIAAPTISTASLPASTVTGTYNQTLSAIGGSGVYVSWTATNLPPGLSFDTTTGTISAAPTSAGTYSVDFTVTDSNSLTSPVKNLTMIVNDVPAITTASLPNAQDSVAYGPVTLSMTGGTGTMTWNVTPALPTSMTFDTTTGTIAGTPDALTNTGSPYCLDYTVKDSTGVTSAIQNLCLTVIP